MHATLQSIRNPFHELGPSLFQIAGAALLASFAALWLVIWLSSSAAMVNALEHVKQCRTVLTAVQQTATSIADTAPVR